MFVGVFVHQCSALLTNSQNLTLSIDTFSYRVINCHPMIKYLTDEPILLALHNNSNVELAFRNY